MAHPNSPWILEAESETFQAQVIERSHELPVVVDFWAEWCQPCRLLAPVLEKLAIEYAGRFLLVKAETERLPQITAEFGVQSIPAVYGLRDGQLIDTFVGVLPEAQLRGWIDRLLPSPAELLLAAARRLEADDPAAAEARYREAVALDPQLWAAKIGLAAVLAGAGRPEEARVLLEELEDRGFLEPEAERLKSQLDVITQGRQAGGVAACRGAASADPENAELQLKLVEALAAEAQYAEALEVALGLIARDRKRFGDTARKIMVDIFRLLPADSELTTTYRRKLSTALY